LLIRILNKVSGEQQKGLPGYQNPFDMQWKALTALKPCPDEHMDGPYIKDIVSLLRMAIELTGVLVELGNVVNLYCLVGELWGYGHLVLDSDDSLPT
jgi:hypothetical protein